MCFLIVTMSLLQYMGYYVIVCTLLDSIISVIVIVSDECVRYCCRYSSYMTLIMDAHAMNMY